MEEYGTVWNLQTTSQDSKIQDFFVVVLCSSYDAFNCTCPYHFVTKSCFDQTGSAKLLSTPSKPPPSHAAPKTQALLLAQLSSLMGELKLLPAHVFATSFRLTRQNET